MLLSNAVCQCDQPVQLKAHLSNVSHHVAAGSEALSSARSPHRSVSLTSLGHSVSSIPCSLRFTALTLPSVLVLLLLAGSCSSLLPSFRTFKVVHAQPDSDPQSQSQSQSQQQQQQGEGQQQAGGSGDSGSQSAIQMGPGEGAVSPRASAAFPVTPFSGE